jgi:hypothetical protein
VRKILFETLRIFNTLPNVNSQRTTRRRSRKTPPDFSTLLRDRGYTPVRLAAETAVSHTTIYRAKLGTVPKPVLVRALATALGITEAECRASIERVAS